MALMYPWATKEYLLWNMSIGQIILYHNIGMEIKYGKGKSGGAALGLTGLSAEELRRMRDEIMPRPDPDPDATRTRLREQYGDIGDV